METEPTGGKIEAYRAALNEAELARKGVSRLDAAAKERLRRSLIRLDESLQTGEEEQRSKSNAWADFTSAYFLQDAFGSLVIYLIVGLCWLLAWILGYR